MICGEGLGDETIKIQRGIRGWVLMIFLMLALYQKVYRKLVPFLNPH